MERNTMTMTSVLRYLWVTWIQRWWEFSRRNPQKLLKLRDRFWDFKDVFLLTVFFIPLEIWNWQVSSWYENRWCTIWTMWILFECPASRCRKDSTLFLDIFFTIFFQCDNDSGLGEYATIHVTPEAAFSYVSFETNIAAESFMDLIMQVINIFLPGKFIITFYASWVRSSTTQPKYSYPIIQTSVASSFHQELKECCRIDDCRRNDIQFSSFQVTMKCPYGQTNKPEIFRQAGPISAQAGIGLYFNFL